MPSKPIAAASTFWDDQAVRCEIRDHFHAVYTYERGGGRIAKRASDNRESTLTLSAGQAARLDELIRSLALTEVKDAPSLPPGGYDSLVIDRSQAPGKIMISPHYQGDYHQVAIPTWEPLIRFLRALE